MQLPSGRFALKARYLLPVQSPPLADGLLTIDGECIEAIGQREPSCPTIDLGNVAILPGLINAHTHLEFSDLADPLGAAGMALPDWIRHVVERRRAAAATGDDITRQREQAYRQGLAESIAVGVTTLADIATVAWPQAALRDSKIDCTVLLELLGLRAERVQPIVQTARKHLETSARTGHWRPGLSPHAPYTVHPELLNQACRLSADARIPLAMHLAESREELELLRSASGPFVEMLRELGAWDAAAIPRLTRPLDYLQQLAVAHRALVVHGNILDDGEIAFIAANKGRMSVVYCPRTHAYFDHGRYRLSEMLAWGVNVALGTDSRASNPDLSLLEEMRHVVQHHADVAQHDVVRMGTLAGAIALGLERRVGSLAVGKRADLAVVRLPQRDASPAQLLFESTEPVVMTVVAGRLAAGQLAAD